MGCDCQLLIKENDDDDDDDDDEGKFASQRPAFY